MTKKRILEKEGLYLDSYSLIKFDFKQPIFRYASFLKTLDNDSINEAIHLWIRHLSNVNNIYGLHQFLLLNVNDIDGLHELLSYEFYQLLRNEAMIQELIIIGQYTKGPIFPLDFSADAGFFSKLSTLNLGIVTGLFQTTFSPLWNPIAVI